MTSTHIGKLTVFFQQSEEFHTLKREIFTRDVYYLELDTPTPVIIDAGAHIGLATLYFKKIFPNSKIWAVEPIKENFKLLEKNIQENFFDDVTLIQAALTEEGQETTLYVDSSDLRWFSTAGGESGAWNNQQLTYPRKVPAVQLSALIEQIGQPIDLLKIDIEGAELSILKEALQFLNQVKNMIIEHHPIKANSLSDLLELLQNAGFAITLWKDGKEITPKRARGLVYVQATKK
jgi:FkbM family methyltransferase